MCAKLTSQVAISTCKTHHLNLHKFHKPVKRLTADHMVSLSSTNIHNPAAALGPD